MEEVDGQERTSDENENVSAATTLGDGARTSERRRRERAARAGLRLLLLLLRRRGKLVRVAHGRVAHGP